MTLEACTELLREHDPERFGAVFVAAPEDRPALVTLYAANLEIARAPLQSTEPMIGLMRLQWWVDRLTEMGQGTKPPLHDVLTPLWEAWGAGAGELVPLAEARMRDTERMPFDRPEEVIDYIDATTGVLVRIAAARLGASDTEVVSAQAQGIGLTNWLRALPQLQAIGLGMARQNQAGIKHLAQSGMQSFGIAKQGHKTISKAAAAALYPGPKATAFLLQVTKGDIDCFRATPTITPFQSRASLALLALTGRWWR